jgi:hypothetical protein
LDDLDLAQVSRPPTLHDDKPLAIGGHVIVLAAASEGAFSVE